MSTSTTVALDNPRLLRSNNHTGFRGISRTRDGRWIAQIRGENSKSRYLGAHITPEEAAAAYDDAAFELRGFHAVLNFPERYRHIEDISGAARVPVAGGFVIIDKEDVPLVLTNHCTIERISTRSPSVYVVYNDNEGKTIKKRLAAVILGLDKGEPAIFINGDRFDHRRENLLSGTETGNTTAIQGRDDIGSGYKGVMAHLPSHSFNARLWNNGKAISLGYFKTAQEAADAYDAKAQELWGENALTNRRIGAVANEKTIRLEKEFAEFHATKRIQRAVRPTLTERDTDFELDNSEENASNAAILG